MDFPALVLVFVNPCWFCIFIHVCTFKAQIRQHGSWFVLQGWRSRVVTGKRCCRIWWETSATTGSLRERLDASEAGTRIQSVSQHTEASQSNAAVWAKLTGQEYKWKLWQKTRYHHCKKMLMNRKTSPFYQLNRESSAFLQQAKALKTSWLLPPPNTCRQQVLLMFTFSIRSGTRSRRNDVTDQLSWY